MPQKFKRKPVMFVALSLVAILGNLSATQTSASAAAAFELPNAEGTKSATVGSAVKVETLFTSVSANTAVYTLDTEVYQGNTRVAQWIRDWTVKPGERKRVTQHWDTSGLGAGTYTIKTGVFKGWSNNYAWRNDAGTITLTGASNPASRAASPAPAAPAPLAAASTISSNPSGSFYADPSSQALVAAKDLRNQGRGGDAAVVEQIGYTPTAIWLGAWSGDTRTTVNDKVSAASSKGQTPIFVAYNIPNRDCGSYSAGGAWGADGYRSYINGIAAGINGRNAVVIVEPDALPGIDCLNPDQQNERYSLIRYAVDTLSTSGTSVYVDAGNFTWKSASVMADRLRRVGIDGAAGFSLNVSGYESTSASASYGDELSGLLQGKKYVIDTSRNGNGSNGDWCNPAGRHTGSYPTTNTGRANAAAYLWIKQPGESDGYCNGGPGAGSFWTQRAIELGR